MEENHSPTRATSRCIIWLRGSRYSISLPPLVITRERHRSIAQAACAIRHSLFNSKILLVIDAPIDNLGCTAKVGIDYSITATSSNIIRWGVLYYFPTTSENSTAPCIDCWIGNQYWILHAKAASWFGSNEHIPDLITHITLDDACHWYYALLHPPERKWRKGHQTTVSYVAPTLSTSVELSCPISILPMHKDGIWGSIPLKSLSTGEWYCMSRYGPHNYRVSKSIHIHSTV